MFILDKADSTWFSPVCQPLDEKSDIVYNGLNEQRGYSNDHHGSNEKENQKSTLCE